MIIETSSGKKFQVRFMKASVPAKFKRADGTTRHGTSVVTGCQVIRVGEGISRQNPQDKYDHVLGKRIALGRALDQLPELFECDRKAIIAAFEKKFGKAEIKS